jgi:hypothetical protein
VQVDETTEYLWESLWTEIKPGEKLDPFQPEYESKGPGPTSRNFKDPGYAKILVYDKYLALPSIVSKNRTQAFPSIKDRVCKRLNDWKLKFLSLAGKEVLLKVVVQVVPTYSMSIFLLPKTLCKELNSMMQRFWWGHQENATKTTRWAGSD